MISFKNVFKILVFLSVTFNMCFSYDIKTVSEDKTVDLIRNAINDVERKNYTYAKQDETLIPMPEGGYGE